MTDGQTPEPQPETEKAGARGGPLKRALLFSLLVLLLAGGYAAYDAHTFMTTPASPEAGEVIVHIPPGASFDRVARNLHAAGVITDVPRFRILARFQKKLGSVQAGEFALSADWTPDKVLAQITGGKSLLYRLSLREGLPWWDAARLVEESGFASAADFEAVIHDPEFLRRYGIPFANAEGFLYPETYFLQKPKTLGGREQAETVARILVETFWRRSWPELVRYGDAEAAQAAQTGTPALLPALRLLNGVLVRTPQKGQQGEPPPPLVVPVSVERLRAMIILASLVEKETGVPEERARVAGVYANRLKAGMLLQCDPTIIYGLGRNQSGPIRRSQLEDAANLFNTYKHPGLPPGPICSPGAASIQAAVTPETHRLFYFVATGKADGSHTFSANLKDHERAVRAYRAAQGR
jgi:UPF0755 protein